MSRERQAVEHGAAYLRRLQRENEGYAAHVVETIAARTKERRAGLEFLSDMIERAASGTSAWSITLDPDSVKLNVGPVRLANFRAEGLWFCAAGPREPGWPRRSLHIGKRPGRVYQRVPIDSDGYDLALSEISRIPRTLRARGLEYVDAAAARRQGKSTWWRAHSPGFLVFLEAYLGTRLPRPVLGDRVGVAGSQYHGDGLPIYEGAPVEVVTTVYERDARARALCLKAHGFRCVCCGDALAERYGPIAASIIHVHHVSPLSARRGRRRVDPARDLRPVCPNCHAVIHAGGRTLSIEEVQLLLRTTSRRGRKP